MSSINAIELIKYSAVIVFFSLLLSGCSHTEDNDLLKKEFIEKYTLLDAKCKDNLKEVLKPFHLEDDSVWIDQIYLLEIFFDSSFTYSQEFEHGIYIGLIFNSDIYDIYVIGLYPELGEIHTCQYINGKKTIMINNTSVLFRDLSVLANNNCVSIDTSMILKLDKNDGRFFKTIMATQLYGTWQLNDTTKLRFKNEFYNNIWCLERKRRFTISDLQKDTSLQMIYNMDGEFFINETLNDTFEILTLSEKTLVLRHVDSDNIQVLNKIE